jgi:hypothetical protein
MKIDYSKIVLNLKVAPKVRTTNKTERKVNPPKKLTKLVNGIVRLVNGRYTCFVDYNEFSERMFANVNVNEITTTTASIDIPFTIESYHIHDFKSIFTKTKEKYGYVCLVRTESQVIFGNYPPSKYLPFAPNWIVRGWIVKINDTIQFKLRNLVTVEGHYYRYKGLLDDDEFEWFKANKEGKK